MENQFYQTVLTRVLETGDVASALLLELANLRAETDGKSSSTTLPALTDPNALPAKLMAQCMEDAKTLYKCTGFHPATVEGGSLLLQVDAEVATRYQQQQQQQSDVDSGCSSSYPLLPLVETVPAATMLSSTAATAGSSSSSTRSYPTPATDESSYESAVSTRGKRAWQSEQMQRGGKRQEMMSVVEEDSAPSKPAFVTASDKLLQQVQSRVFGNRAESNGNNQQQSNRRSLGGRRKFVSPMPNSNGGGGSTGTYDGGRNSNSNNDGGGESGNVLEELDPTGENVRLRTLDPKLVETIRMEVLDRSPRVTWNDIAGLDGAKRAVKEATVLPLRRPDLFTDLRSPPKGLLLFGPPGTGKTMIGKAIACESGATFFNISSSSLTSKWIGEGEKLVRALFGVASALQPAVIFIDEIDSLLTQRSEHEQEASRRIKTEFLVQIEGAAAATEERILLIGATNRPYELDDAARRRLTQRLYIPLPDHAARAQLIKRLFQSTAHELAEEDFEWIAEKTDGYSGSDLRSFCREAAMPPLREVADSLDSVEAAQVRPVQKRDLEFALRVIRPSVAEKDLTVYEEWNKEYGTFGV